MNFYKFYQIISESMDVRVKDAEYKNPMATLDDLSWDLMTKLRGFFSSFTQEQKEYMNKNRTPEIVAGDGLDGYRKNQGIINVYLRGIPEELRSKFKEAILYFLKDSDIETGEPYQDKSNVYGGETIRIPVKKMPKPKNNPPELNMANGNAHHIFHNVLGFEDVGNGFVISARDLLMKIDTYNHDLADFDARLDKCSGGSCGKANLISVGLSGDQIRQRLEIIRNIAKWAIDNDYDTIQVF